MSPEDFVVPPGPGDEAGQVDRHEIPEGLRSGYETGAFSESSKPPLEESQWLEEARDVQAGPGSALVQDLKASRELWAQALPSRSSRHPWADHMGCAGEHSHGHGTRC